MSGKLRILVVTNMFPSAGKPTDGVFVSRQVNALRGVAGDALEVEVLHVNTVASRARYVSGNLSFLRAVRRFKPDVVHVHYGLTQLVTSSWRGPKVVTFHGSDLTLRWQRAISTALLREGDVPVVVSSRLVEHLPKELRACAMVISCGVGSDFITDDSSRPPHVTDGPLRIGFPASIHRPGKDYPLFKATMTALEARGVQVEEVILDLIDPPEMPQLLRSLDVLMMTSRYEGSPVVTREGLCSGVRVVSVDVGDMSDQLSGMDGCALVRERNPEYLAKAVVEVLRCNGPNPRAAGERFNTGVEAEAVLTAYQVAHGRNR